MQFGLLAIIFLFSYHFVPHSETSYFWRLPPLLKELPGWINTLLDNLMFQWLAVDVWDPVWKEYEQRPVFRIITRAIGSGILFVITFVRELFLGGAQTIGAFFSDSFLDANEWLYWPALPWTAIVAGAAILGYQLQGFRLALLAGIGVAYLCIFGQWQPSLETLSFVLVCAPICFIFGLGFGIWGYLNKTVEAALQPLLNTMQTMPHFSYLIPVMVLFGVGDHAGAVATIIFATPPMIRLTILGLKKVSPDIVDAGSMSGCTKSQLLFKVLIPTARTDILIGVNQVIMQCLAMTVVAAFIGAKGLGSDLKIALNSLEIGKASEIGLSVVLIAVILDKYSLAWANKQKDYFSDLTFLQKYKPYIGFILLTLVATFFAYLGALYFKDGINYLYYVPVEKGFTISPFIDSGIDWFWEAFFPYLNAFNVWLIESVLVPMREAYLGMPVISTFILVMGAGYIVGGVRSAVIVGGLILFIALSEYWDRALITAYMATFAVLISAVLGIVVGSICAQNHFASKTILSVCDFFQTFPSFIYLIPVILLFGITDPSVMIAAIVYAVIPATRYTVEGLNSVPVSLHEAGTMSGVSRLQRWVNIELPLAVPHIMLGINQTVVFALVMVIFGALIGTIDLGQLIMASLSKKGGAGIGFTLGIFVAFMCLAVDNLIQTWAKERKKALGID